MRRLAPTGLTGLAASSDVIGPDVERAFALGRIAILGDDQSLISAMINHGRLIGRVDRAQCDSVGAFYQQIVKDPGLFGGRSI